MKSILVTVFSLVSLMAFSQLSLKKLDGSIINDGDVLSFSQTSEPENYLGLKIFNSLNEDVTVKVKVISFPAGLGSNLQLCVEPICVNNLIAGNSYPSFGSIIPANGQNGNSDHFLNENMGDGTTNLDYVLKLFRVDENNIEIGNSITFTYRYTPNLANSSFNLLANEGAQLKSTVIKSAIDINASKPLQVSVYDLNGKEVINQNLNIGDNSLDASKLASGIYLLQVANTNGKKTTIKISKE